MPSFDSLAAVQALNLRKGLVGALFVADYSATALTDICTTGGALTALTGHASLGKLTTDGVSFSDNIETSELRGWGDISSPSRVDVTSETLSMTASAMETKKTVIDNFYGVDQSAVQASATTGTITFDKPTLPTLRDKRVLMLVRDINKSNGLDIYIGVYFLRANIKQNGEQAFNNNDSGIVYPLSIDALKDDVAGTACRFFFGGPGLAGLVTGMGYTVAS